MLELRLLGPIQFSINDDHSLTLPVRKEEALLAYLATEHGHPHSRDSLVALLWPDAPPENARLSLRVNLANLKKRLKRAEIGTLFHSTPLVLQFAAGACRLDIVEFSRDLRSGEHHDRLFPAPWPSTAGHSSTVSTSISANSSTSGSLCSGSASAYRCWMRWKS
jgi:DNA-binding SARP family transcriptional activator